MDKEVLEKVEKKVQVVTETPKQETAKAESVTIKAEETTEQDTQFKAPNEEMPTETLKENADVPKEDVCEDSSKEIASKDSSKDIFSKLEIKKSEETSSVDAEPLSKYLATFKDLTLKDVKKEEKVQEKSKNVEITAEAETTSNAETLKTEQPQETPKETPKNKPKKTTLIIEKPNYDLMSKKKGSVKKKKRLKTALLACALAVCTVGCVAGTIICDNMNSHYMQLEDTYNLNLLDYLNKINNLNATNKGFEFIETYPEDMNEISSIGESTNWFDNLVNFITGLFGG